MSGYKSLTDAYKDGFVHGDADEPDNLWSPYASDEEVEIWKHGWRDAVDLRTAQEAFAEETKRVSRAYRDLDERR